MEAGDQTQLSELQSLRLRISVNAEIQTQLQSPWSSHETQALSPDTTEPALWPLRVPNVDFSCSSWWDSTAEGQKAAIAGQPSRHVRSVYLESLKMHNSKSDPPGLRASGSKAGMLLFSSLGITTNEKSPLLEGKVNTVWQGIGSSVTRAWDQSHSVSTAKMKA